MTDPTREQVQEALDWQERGDQPDRLIDGINPILIIQTAARAWLETTEMTKDERAQFRVARIRAHRIDEAMIERAARVSIRLWAENEEDYEPLADDLAIAEAMLRAALEVTE